MADQAELVRIDESRIGPVASMVASLPPVDSDAMSVEFAVTFNAVNFGSGWHPHLTKLPGCSGSATIMHLLRRRFDDDGPFSADDMAALIPDDCARLFGQSMRPPVDELMALFVQSLNDLGRFLLERFGGAFDALVAAAGRSATDLVELLQEMPMYRDVSTYRGRPVPFLKRAQLTSSDLGCFDDLDRLTLFADNLVPHVLRLEGVLVFDPDLVRTIESGDLLPAGGQAETEMRAAAVHAVELMTAALKGSMTARDLDYRLWHLGQDPRFKSVPRPRARSIYY